MHTDLVLLVNCQYVPQVFLNTRILKNLSLVRRICSSMCNLLFLVAVFRPLCLQLVFDTKHVSVIADL